MAFLSIEEENYVRMSLLLTGISPRAVRTYFDDAFVPACLDASLKKEYNTLFDLKRERRINQLQWKLLFPRFPDAPDSKTFDVTLMTTLLRNLTEMTPPLCGFDSLPDAMDITPAADIARIKHYRNNLAHLDDGKIDITFFNTAWNDITSAIERLGGHQMKQECDHMKTKPLDQTNQEIMMEVNHSKNEIRELKESFEIIKLSYTEVIKSHEILQENHAVVTKEMEEIQKYQKDTDPWNLRAQHQQETSEWDQDETTFVETRATRYILGSLLSKNCIVVTGSSGCGKSSNIHHTALHLRDKFGYEIIPVLTGPSDIIIYNNPKRKQVFVVDDICGKESINTQLLQMWRDYEERLKKIFKPSDKNLKQENYAIVSEISHSKLLISCRLQIYKEPRFQLVELLTREECNLISDDLNLSNEERMIMMKKYLSEDIINNVIKIMADVDFFPLLCKLSIGKSSNEVIKLFTAPLTGLQRT